MAILKLDREANTQAVGQMFCLQHRDGCGKDDQDPYMVDWGIKR